MQDKLQEGSEQSGRVMRAARLERSILQPAAQQRPELSPRRGFASLGSDHINWFGAAKRRQRSINSSNTLTEQTASFTNSALGLAEILSPRRGSDSSRPLPKARKSLALGLALDRCSAAGKRQTKAWTLNWSSGARRAQTFPWFRQTILSVTRPIVCAASES